MTVLAAREIRLSVSDAPVSFGWPTSADNKMVEVFAVDYVSIMSYTTRQTRSVHLMNSTPNLWFV